MAAKTILNPQVSVIPATKRHVQNGDQFRRQTSIRVAAYCRVSTEEESQENSYTAQKNHYTALILNRPGWEMAGIYADEGKSGTTRKGRIHFNELMEDCRRGKVDYVITKSISRFARNTIDALDCVHELQRLHPPVGIYFERENIDTLNANSEMFLTFYCSMAQEESRSISENIKWSLQKNFRSGRPQINLRRMLGYDMCRDGNWIINAKEAAIVCQIYRRFLEGASANAIARELNQSGFSTVTGKQWRADAVLYILHNEKYVGDLIMQKTYTESYLTHKSVRNTGEYPQYFKEDHHPAIISRDVWNRTQELIAYKHRGKKHSIRTVETATGKFEIGLDGAGKSSHEVIRLSVSERKPRGAGGHAFMGILCAECKRPMKRMTYNSTIRGYRDERSHEGKEVPPEESDFTDTYTFSYAVWKCPGSAGKNGRPREGCQALTLTEASMEQSFMEMLYRIKQDVEQNGEEAELVRSFQAVYKALCQKEAGSRFIEQKLGLLELELAELRKNYETALERVRTASYTAGITLGVFTYESGGSAYTKLAEDLKEKIEEKEREKARLMGERGVAQTMKQNFTAFLEELGQLPKRNGAGLKLNVREPSTEKKGPGAKGQQAAASQEKAGETGEPLDYLCFNEYIFRTFILHLEAARDEVHYTTTFGLTLSSSGNSRPISSYIGYRLCRPDGTVSVITESYQIGHGKIQHHWKKKRKG